MWVFKPVQPVKLVDGVDVPPSDQHVVYLLLEDVVLRNDAIQDFFEEFDEASPVVYLFVGRLEEGDGLED